MQATVRTLGGAADIQMSNYATTLHKRSQMLVIWNFIKLTTVNTYLPLICISFMSTSSSACRGACILSLVLCPLGCHCIKQAKWRWCVNSVSTNNYLVFVCKLSFLGKLNLMTVLRIKVFKEKKNLSRHVQCLQYT